MRVMILGVALALGAAVLAAVVFWLVARYVPARWLRADADAASTVYATIGLVYAVLVAIAAIVVWEPHDAASQSAAQESNDLVQVYYQARRFPPADRDRVQVLVRRYLDTVATTEWRSMQREHTGTARAQGLLDELRSTVDGLNSDDEITINTISDMSSRLEDAYDARRTRIAAADSAMPATLWASLVVGSVISVGFLLLFNMRPTFPHALMLAVTAGMVMVLLFVLYQLEYPYSRGLSVSPDAFRTALSSIAAVT